jgi:uncharacterized RmlC-like cupin family protein
VTGGAIEALSEDFDGGYTVTFQRFGPDLDHTAFLKGAPDDRCQCHHWGYVLEGRVTFRFADREETVRAGDAFYVPPGHIPVGNDPGTLVVQFTPTDELRDVQAVIARNLQAMQATQ